MGKVYCEGGQFGLLLYHGRLDLREREEIKFQVVDLHDWTEKRKERRLSATVGIAAVCNVVVVVVWHASCEF